MPQPPACCITGTMPGEYLGYPESRIRKSLALGGAATKTWFVPIQFAARAAHDAAGGADVIPEARQHVAGEGDGEQRQHQPWAATAGRGARSGASLEILLVCSS